jgi:hypothetical protein
MTEIANPDPDRIHYSQRHGSADPHQDPNPDPHQNVMDPEHCFVGIFFDPIPTFSTFFMLKFNFQ